jgi:hypothetical protein
MTRQRATSAWWEPTWQRVVGSTVVLFVVILAFLVGRVRAGADPGLARETTRATTQTAPRTVSPTSPGADPTDPFGQTPADPGTNGSSDNLGNAVPDQGAGGQDDGGAQDDGGGQDLDPPSTHVS